MKVDMEKAGWQMLALMLTVMFGVMAVCTVLTYRAPPVAPIKHYAVVDGDLNRACDPRDDVRTSELCAVWKSADADRESANWGYWAFLIGTIVNFLTLVGVAFGWMETRKATRIAKDALASDSRAWLRVTCTCPDGFEPVFRFRGDVKPCGFAANINIEIENCGSSPAVNARYFVQSAILTEDERAHEKYSNFCSEVILRTHFDRRAIFPSECVKIVEHAYFSIDIIDQKFEQGKILEPIFIICVLYDTKHVENLCVTSSLYNVSDGSGDQYVIIGSNNYMYYAKGITEPVYTEVV